MKFLFERPQMRACLLFLGAAAAVLLGSCNQQDSGEQLNKHESRAVAAAEPQKPAPLKVGFLYVGKVGEAGWTFSHDSARKALEEKFGEAIETSIRENIPEGEGAEATIRDLIAQGNKLIIATSFGYGEALEKVAKDHPEVKFEHATGYKTSANLRVFEGRLYEAAFLAGVIAGKMTKTNILGFVGSIPVPEVLRNVNAFTLGAQTVNPKIKTKVFWVNAWFDPLREGEAAQKLIKQKADVLLQSTDSSAVLQAAEKHGKFAFGWDSDMSRFAPKAHLASAVWNWAPYYEKSVNDVLNQAWQSEVTKWGVKEGINDLVKISEVVPLPVRKKVEGLRDDLRSGNLVVFKGPIFNNAGKLVLPKGQIADEAWTGQINFYVKGIEGKVPGAH